MQAASITDTNESSELSNYSELPLPSQTVQEIVNQDGESPLDAIDSHHFHLVFKVIILNSYNISNITCYTFLIFQATIRFSCVTSYEDDDRIVLSEETAGLLLKVSVL